MESVVKIQIDLVWKCDRYTRRKSGLFLRFRGFSLLMQHSKITVWICYFSFHVIDLGRQSQSKKKKKE